MYAHTYHDLTAPKTNEYFVSSLLLKRHPDQC